VPGSGGCPGFVMNTGEFKALEAMQEWVEKGKAPEQIIYSHREGGGRGGKVYRTRPVCAYPKVAKYKGTGDINDAGSFTCVAPAK
jgi:feruloyl esterase